MFYPRLRVHSFAQVRGLVIENTFTGVQDMVSRVVPPLSLLIGTGRPCNFLVTNKWPNLQLISRIHLPMLMMVSLRVSPSRRHGYLHATAFTRPCSRACHACASYMSAVDSRTSARARSDPS
jgi:hypothetical protein